MRFLERLGLMGVRVAVGVVVRVVVKLRCRADRDRDDGWVGHTAALP